MIANLLKTLIMVALGVGIFIFGYKMAITNVADWRFYIDSASWLKIPSEITNLNLMEQKEGDDVEYIISCAYRYRLDNVEYHGSRIDLTSKASIRASSSRRYLVLKLYKDVDKKIIARVNPLKPEQSLLFHEITSAMALMAAGAFILLFIGCAFIVKGVYDIIISRAEKQKDNYSDFYLILSSTCIILLLIGLYALFIGVSEWKNYFACKNLFSSLNNSPLPPEFSFSENFPNMFFTIAWSLIFFIGCYLLSNRTIFKPIREIIREKRGRQFTETDRPWHCNPQWRRFRIVSHKPVSNIKESFGWGCFLGIFISLFIIAIFFMGGIKPDASSTSIAIPFFNFSHKSVFNNIVNIVFICIFYGFILLIVALSLGHLWSGFYRIFQYLWHGPPTLFLSQTPFLPGEKSMAWLSFGAETHVFEKIEVHMFCVGEGYNVYEDKHILTIKMKKHNKNHYVLPIEFDIPKNQPSTSFTNPKYTWKVKLSAVTKDAEFEENFEIPVYHVDDPELVERPSKPFFSDL